MHNIPRALALSAIALASLVTSSPIDFSASPQHQAKRDLMSGYSHIAKRDVKEIICGFYPSASYKDTITNSGNLRKKGDLNVHVAAHTCNRVGCYTTSGMYVCNDQDVDLDVPMSEALALLDFTWKTCLVPEPGSHQSGDGSGRVTTDERGGYNVNIGYCNGRDPVDIPPSGYGWPGPNGTPIRQCGKDDQEPCEGTGCIEGSIVVESQEPVGCSDYLGANYVGAGAIYTYTTSRTITETWTVGGFLSIDTSDLAPVSTQLGFFSSFSKATTVGSNTGISATCGDEDSNGTFTCGMHIKPQCYAMTGYCDTEATGRVPWANVVPQTSSDGVGVFTSEICKCQNCDGADDETAPSEECGLECAGCI